MEYRAAPEAVGRRAGDEVADELSGEGRGGQGADLDRGKVEFGGERPQQEGEQRDVDLVHQPGRGDHREEATLVAGHRQALEPPDDVGAGRHHDARHAAGAGRPKSRAAVRQLTLSSTSGARPMVPRSSTLWRIERNG